jgi:hypothetical protein
MTTTTSMVRMLATDDRLLQWQLDRIFEQVPDRIRRAISAIEAKAIYESGEGELLMFYDDQPLVVRSQLDCRVFLDTVWRLTGIRIVTVSSGCNLHRFQRRISGWWAIEKLYPGGMAA